MTKIVEIMGLPSKDRWPLLTAMPEYHHMTTLGANNSRVNNPQGLDKWYWGTLNQQRYGPNMSAGTPGQEGLALLAALLEYDPQKRLTAEQALKHPYFTMEGDPLKILMNCFEYARDDYPLRRVSQEDNDMRISSLPGTKRPGLPDDSLIGGRPMKRVRD